MAEMEEYVFTVEGKGETLRAYLQIAMGWREEGMELLTQFITKNESNLKLETRLQNLKKNKVEETEPDIDVTLIFPVKPPHGKKARVRRTKRPGVYARVTYQLDWIKDNMKGEVCPSGPIVG